MKTKHFVCTIHINFSIVWVHTMSQQAPKPDEFSFGILSSSPGSPKIEELSSSHDNALTRKTKTEKYPSSSHESSLKQKEPTESSEPKLTATQWQHLYEKQKQQEHRRSKHQDRMSSKKKLPKKVSVKDAVKSLPLTKQYILWAAEHASHPATLSDVKKAILEYPGTYYDIFHDERIDRSKLMEERKKLGRYLKGKSGDYFQSGTQFRQFVEHLRPGLSKIIYKYENVAS